MAAQDSADLLAQLRGIHLPVAPAEPESWPLLLAAVIILIALLVFILRRYNSRASWAKEAQRELDRIEEKDSLQGLQSTAVLLKRIVLTHDKSAEIKQLSGDRWLEYLDVFFSTRYFTESDGQMFGTAQYRKHYQLSVENYEDIKALIKRKARSNEPQTNISTKTDAPKARSNKATLP